MIERPILEDYAGYRGPAALAFDKAARLHFGLVTLVFLAVMWSIGKAIGGISPNAGGIAPLCWAVLAGLVAGTFLLRRRRGFDPVDETRERPSAMTWFDRIVLAYIVLQVGDALLILLSMNTLIAQYADKGANAWSFVAYFAKELVNLLAWIAAWFCISRLRSEAARWLLATYAVANGLQAAWLLSPFSQASDILGIAAVFRTIPALAGTACLFTRDARQWFAYAGQTPRVEALRFTVPAAGPELQRPVALARFDALYITYIAVALTGLFKSFPALRAVIEDRLPGGTFLQFFSLMVATFLGLLLLWYFVSRRRSRIALAILAVDAANSVLGALFPGPVVRADTILWGLSLVSAALNAGAICCLFTPEAHAWFFYRPGEAKATAR